MARGRSKVNHPNSHPSNPVHKTVQIEAKPAAQPKELTSMEETKPIAGYSSKTHDMNKMAVVVVAVAVAGLVLLALH